MAIGATKSHTRIEKNRKWEDYQSLKRYWSARGNVFREVIFNGVQTSTNGAVEFLSGCGETIAYLGANDVVYAAQELDTEAQDGQSIWMDYINSSGDLYEGIETKLDSVTSTATFVPIGCLSSTYVDAIAAVNGDVFTMTNLDRTIDNDLAGWYVVGCGDATHREGQTKVILSNTAAAPTLITVTVTPNADWAADNVSIQKTLNSDVFRIRRLYTELEGAAGKAYTISDKDGTNIYGVIPDTNTYGNAGSRYTALDTTLYRCFLGQVVLEAPQSFGADTDPLGFQVAITFTPLPMTGQTAADITLTFDFIDKLVWEPCIELAEASDVIITIKKTTNDAHAEVRLDFTCLEVTL